MKSEELATAKMTIDFISLGCSKNLVDSEVLMGLFEANGFHVTHDSDDPQGEIVVVNTCGFIADAKEESINTILEQVARKNEGLVKQIYRMVWEVQLQGTAKTTHPRPLSA